MKEVKSTYTKQKKTNTTTYNKRNATPNGAAARPKSAGVPRRRPRPDLRNFVHAIAVTLFTRLPNSVHTIAATYEEIVAT